MGLNPEIRKRVDELRGEQRSANQTVLAALDIMHAASGLCSTTDSKDFLVELSKAGQYICIVFPEIPYLHTLISRLHEKTSNVTLGEGVYAGRTFVDSLLHELHEERKSTTARIATCGAGMVHDGDTVFTFSYSSTVLAALKTAKDLKSFRVVVPRSGANHGGLIMARELNQAGIDVTCIDDAAINGFLPGSRAVLLGADRICSDRTLVNATGTSLVVKLAELYHIPVYVLCENLKYHPGQTGSSVSIPEMNRAVDLPSSVVYENPAWDVTPLGPGTFIISEDGVFTSSNFFSSAAFVR